MGHGRHNASQKALDAAISEHNRDVLSHVLAAGLMGLLSSLGLLVFLVLGSYVVFSGRGSWHLFGLGAFVLVFLVGLWSGRRGVDPLRDLDPFTHDDFGAVVATAALTGMITSPRHAVAGAASLIIHGPVTLLAAIGQWRRRINVSSELLATSQDLLLRLVKERRVLVGSVPSRDAASLLLRLGMAKLDRIPDAPASFKPTAKADVAVGGSS